MSSRLFSRKALRELVTPLPDLIRQSLDRDEVDSALARCDELARSQVVLHDFFAESCTVFWSWVGRHLGEKTVEPMFRYVFQQAADRQFFAAACVDAPPHLSVLLLAQSWRAHSCFGAGEHPGRFSISEDSEKFTFHLHPCGSGLRLWRKGFYAPGSPGKRTEAARPWSYRRERFPYYCLHCPFLNEILPYESAYGALLWPVDPPANAKDDCAWHIYKNPNRIPDHYYQRLGLKRKKVRRSRYYDPDRQYFSEKELAEMARPLTDRIKAAIVAGDRALAESLCLAVKNEFLVLHDLYVNMLAATLTFIAHTAGEEMLGEALHQQWECCLQPLVAKEWTAITPEEKIGFLGRHIFGVDACNGMGRHSASFSVTETQTAFVFRLSPCGSGGRLIRAGSYQPCPRGSRFREGMEERLLKLAGRRLPLSEEFLEKMFPRVVDRFIQRKPYDQGITQHAYPWSFDQAGVPYFCCQCGTIADACRDKGLRISPPATKRDACIWTIKKTF